MFAEVRVVHAGHCRRELRTRAEIIDYRSAHTLRVWRESFDLGFEPPSCEEQARFPFAFMWKGMMNILLGIVNATSEYVFHMDDDFSVTSRSNAGIGSFVEPMMKLFGQERKLVF